MPFASLMALSMVWVDVPPDPLEDLRRFPKRPCIAAMLEFNRAYRSHIETRQAFEPRSHWDWQDVLNETDWCYYCWSALQEARGSSGEDRDSCMAGLCRLRVLLGEQAYLEGCMPPCVPVWRLQRVDSR